MVDLMPKNTPVDQGRMLRHSLRELLTRMRMTVASTHLGQMSTAGTGVGNLVQRYKDCRVLLPTSRL